MSTVSPANLLYPIYILLPRCVYLCGVNDIAPGVPSRVQDRFSRGSVHGVVVNCDIFIVPWWKEA